MKRSNHGEKAHDNVEKFYTGGVFEISFRVSRGFSHIKITHQGHFERVRNLCHFIAIAIINCINIYHIANYVYC